jgi:hypothetical protein
MDLMTQLVTTATATVADIKKFMASFQEAFAGRPEEPLDFPGRLPHELRQSKQAVLGDVVELQRLIMGPSDLIQQLACNVSVSLFSLALVSLHCFINVPFAVCCGF